MTIYHAVAVLESAEQQPCSVDDATDLLSRLCVGVNNLQAAVQMTPRKAVFTVSGQLGSLQTKLNTWVPSGIKGPGTKVSFKGAAFPLVIKSITIAPAEPKPAQQQSQTSSSTDEPERMLDLAIKMTSLAIQGFNS